MLEVGGQNVARKRVRIADHEGVPLGSPLNAMIGRLCADDLVELGEEGGHRGVRKGRVALAAVPSVHRAQHFAPRARTAADGSGGRARPGEVALSAEGSKRLSETKQGRWLCPRGQLGRTEERSRIKTRKVFLWRDDCCLPYSGR